VLPLAWWRRSPALLFCTLAVLFVVTAFAVGGIDARAVLPLLFLLSTAVLFAGATARASAFAAADCPLHPLGLLVALGCSYALSFPAVARELGRVNFDKAGIVVYFAVVAVALMAAIGGGLVVARRVWAQTDIYRRWQWLLVGAGIVIVVAWMMASKKAD